VEEAGCELRRYIDVLQLMGNDSGNLTDTQSAACDCTAQAAVLVSRDVERSNEPLALLKVSD
jgi:hypothetical protein